MAKLALVLLGVPLLNTACKGEGPGDMPPDCSGATQRPLTRDEASPVGTPREVQARLSGTRSGTLEWRDFATGESQTSELVTALTVDLSSAMYVSQSSPACPEYMSLEASLSFETTDEVFTEGFTGLLTIIGEPLDSLFSGTLAASKKRGSYDDSPLLPSYVDPTYFVHYNLEPSGQGELGLTGRDPDEQDDTHLAVAHIGFFTITP